MANIENVATALPLVIVPDSRLAQSCEDVDFTTDPIDQWVRDMTKTMRDNQGMGLAGCQVGIMKRLAIVDVGIIKFVEQHKDAPGDTPHTIPSEIAVFINPTVTWTSEERARHEEGCLSIPDIQAEVERPQRVHVSYRDPKNNPCTLEADGWLAVCLQHEIDHLNGILFISYLSPLKRKRILARFNKAKNKKSKVGSKNSAHA